MQLLDRSTGYTINLAWARNPVWFKMQAEANYQSFGSYYLQAEIKKGTETIVTIPKYSPDENGEFLIEVQQYLESYLEKEYLENALPDPTQITTTQLDYPISIEVIISEYIDDALADSFSYSISMMNAGLDFEHFSHQAQRAWIQTDKRFLTSSSDPKPTTADAPEFLYFLVSELSEVYLDVKVTLYFEDGSSSTFLAFENVYQGKIIIIPTSYLALNLQNFDSVNNRIIEYSIEMLETGSTVSQSEVFRYKLSDQPFLEKKIFLYQNSLGGFDTIICDGVIEEFITSKKENFKRSLSYDYKVLKGGYFTGAQKARRKGKTATVFIDEAYSDSLQDLAISKNVLELKKGKYLPVSINFDTSYYKKHRDLNGYVLNYSYNWDIHLYTKIQERNKIPCYSKNIAGLEVEWVDETAICQNLETNEE